MKRNRSAFNDDPCCLLDLNMREFKPGNNVIRFSAFGFEYFPGAPAEIQKTAGYRINRLNRLLHHARIYNLDGESWRIKDKLKE